MKQVFFIGADYQAGKEHVGAAIKYFKGQAVGPVYTPLSQLDFAPEIARIRAENPDAVFAFLVGAGGIALRQAIRAGGPEGQIPFVHRRPGGQSADLPGAGRCRDRHRHGHELAPRTSTTPANKKFVASFRAKYNRDARDLRGARLRRDQGDRRRGRATSTARSRTRTRCARR